MENTNEINEDCLLSVNLGYNKKDRFGKTGMKIIRLPSTGRDES